jgi:hypothetical protein
MENIETPKPKRVYNRKAVVQPTVDVKPSADDLHQLSEYLKRQMALQTPTETVPVVEPKTKTKKAKVVPIEGEPIVKKPAGKWIDALKKYNDGKKYTIPKKGTPEYLEVRALMETM